MAALSALALLARPDTAILLGLLWLDLMLSQRRIPWREGLLTLAMLAPWLIFGTLYFGSPLTGSMAAKSVTYRLSPEEGAVRLLQHYATPFFEHKAMPSLAVCQPLSVAVAVRAWMPSSTVAVSHEADQPSSPSVSTPSLPG